MRTIIKGFLLFVSVCHISFAQKIGEVMPWAEELGAVELGMNTAEFFRVRPSASSLTRDVDIQNIPESYSGIFYEPNVGIPEGFEGESGTMYTFIKGQLASFYWEKKPNTEASLTNLVRSELYRLYGQPQKGHIPKSSRKNGHEFIAKLNVEVFSISQSKSSFVSLSSSEEGLLVAIIDFDLEKRTTAEKLYFSFDENLKISEKQSSKIGVKFEPDKKFQDYLKEDFKPKSGQRPPRSTQQESTANSSSSENNESSSSASGNSSDEGRKNTWLLILGVVLVLALYFFLRFKK